jgi:hypothetical protein
MREIPAKSRTVRSLLSAGRMPDGVASVRDYAGFAGNEFLEEPLAPVSGRVAAFFPVAYRLLSRGEVH